MSKSCKVTSRLVAKVASKILRSPNYSKAVKRVAGSALSQKPSGRRK